MMVLLYLALVFSFVAVIGVSVAVYMRVNKKMSASQTEPEATPEVLEETVVK